MKILNQPASRMHIWTITLLSALAIISSYTLRQFPSSVLVALFASVLIETAIVKFYLKHKPRIPFSAIITGLIIGSIVPQNAFIVAIAASFVAILSKSFIKSRGTNVFNPAALGIIISIAVFASSDQWWAASNYNIYGIAITLTPILIICSYQARRLTASLSFVATIFIIGLLGSNIYQLSLTGLATIFFSINFLLAFVMLADPKTSPYKRYAQISYGATIAIIVSILAVARAPYPFLLALLIGNLLYFLYRRGYLSSLSLTRNKSEIIDTESNPAL